MGEPTAPLHALSDTAFRAAGLFAAGARLLEVRAYGHGNINDTYLVTPDAGVRFILQRLNRTVFPRPDLVMQNLRVVIDHMHKRLAPGPTDSGTPWQCPRLLPTADGRDVWVAADGSWWRALSFIEGAVSHEVLEHAAHAREAGAALGRFHALLADLPAHRLADTLPGFHVTPLYVQHYDKVAAARRLPASPEAAWAMAFVAARREFMRVLEEARAAGRVQEQVIHGDPKVNNVLLDAATGRAVALVDLDTVKPGLIHYDIGDLVRSGANPAGEETEDWEAVRFAPDLAQALLAGYAAEAGGILTAADRRHLYDAVRLLPMELGLRFFTDYLEGNVYFKARHAEHNLLRALVQFKLAASIEAHEADLSAMIRDLP